MRVPATLTSPSRLGQSPTRVRATFSKGIVTLKGDKEALAGAAYDKALKEKPEETPKNYLRLSTHNVGPNPNSQSTMSDEMAQKINKKHGANINFKQISNYEGGQALRGYVPWWPIIKSISKNGAITVLLNFEKKKDGSFAKTASDNKILSGSSQSGVTIGTGVDLGQQEPTAYKKRLKDFEVSQELIDKLEPYMHLKRAEAAEYLLAQPLTVTKEEADLLDAEMKDDHLKNTIAEYNGIVKDIKKHRAFKELFFSRTDHFVFKALSGWQYQGYHTFQRDCQISSAGPSARCP